MVVTVVNAINCCVIDGVKVCYLSGFIYIFSFIPVKKL